MQRPCVLLVLALLLAVWPGASPARAAPPAWLLGRPWETPILEGIADQDRELKHLQPQALAGKYQRLAARRAGREEMVRRYYLLGRAHGKNAEALRFLGTQARTPRQKAELERQADAAYAQAVRAYRDALGLAPGCYFAYHDLGVLELLRGTGHQAQAIQYLEASARLNARYPAPLRKLALVYRERRDWTRLEAVLRRLIALEPNDVVARMTLAGALAETGRYPQAIRIVDELLRVDPDNVSFRVQRADLDFRAGRVDAAQREFRRLAEASPANPVPLQGYLRCLDWKRTHGKRVEPASFLWVMTRMRRLERRPEVREKLKQQIESLRKQQARAVSGGSKGPPGPEDLARILTGPDEEGRWRVISFLNAVNQPPPKVLRDAVVSRLSAKREPSARVRALALEIAGRQFGFGWMPIARLVTAQDGDPRVRLAGIDAIRRMGDLGATGRAGAVLILGTFLEDRDRTVAAGARVGILALGNGRLHLEENADDDAHRAAFRAWWRGAQGEDLKIESLRRYVALRDPFVEDVLGIYARDPAFYVRQAAYEAFAATRDLLGTPAGRRWYQGKRATDYAAFADWIAKLPIAPGGRLTRENAGALEPKLTRWLAERPRS